MESTAIQMKSHLFLDLDTYVTIGIMIGWELFFFNILSK